jgi:hypothetical protein
VGGKGRHEQGVEDLLLKVDGRFGLSLVGQQGPYQANLFLVRCPEGDNLVRDIHAGNLGESGRFVNLLASGSRHGCNANSSFVNFCPRKNSPFGEFLIGQKLINDELGFTIMPAAGRKKIDETAASP